MYIVDVPESHHHEPSFITTISLELVLKGHFYDFIEEKAQGKCKQTTLHKVDLSLLIRCIHRNRVKNHEQQCEEQIQQVLIQWD